MAKRYLIEIDKYGENEFIFKKNFHLEFLIRGCYAFFSTIVVELERRDDSKVQYVEKAEFKSLMAKLMDSSSIAIVTCKELMWLRDWVDVIINIVLEMEHANFKDKNMKRFLKTAENLMTEINKYNLQIKKN